VDAGLLVLRLAVGLAMAAHGSQKLMGWFEGPGPQGTVAFVRNLGFRPVGLWSAGVWGSEVGGGLLLAAGLLSPLGTLGVAAAMLVATFAAHWGKGFFAQRGGFEVPFLYLAGAAAAGITGPGRYSLDPLFGISLPEPVTGIVGAALVVLGVAAAFASRPRQSAQAVAQGAA